MADNLNGGTGAGVSEDQFYEYLKARANQALEDVELERSRAGGQPPQQQAAPSGIKLNLFGQEREFKDASEVGKSIEQLVANYNGLLQQAQAVIQQQAQQPVQEPKQDALNMDEFVNKIQKDPADAFNYAFQTKYGVGMDYLVERARKTDELEGAMTAIQFKDMNPGFVPTPQNANVLEQIRQGLGLPYTADALSAAFVYGRERGAFGPPQQQQQQQVQQGRPAAPPSLGRTAQAGNSPTSADELIALVERMPTAKAEEFVRQYFQQNG